MVFRNINDTFRVTFTCYPAGTDSNQRVCQLESAVGLEVFRCNPRINTLELIRMNA